MSVNVRASEQQRALDAPLEESVAIVGASGTGKSFTLRTRYERAQSTGVPALWFGHPSDLVRLAREILASVGREIEMIDDVEAEFEFARVAEPVFALEWEPLAAGTVDPEVPGLRSPDRFLVAAFRLIRKFRDGAIGPGEFLQRSLAGATSFYANPPNFAHPDLIYATKDAYRDSLDVDTQELQRQYRREVDLAKVLARLYEAYVDQASSSGRMTARDAIADAYACVAQHRAHGERVRARYPLIFIDDAQDATLATRLLLGSVYGSRLRGVTLAGDPNGATNVFRGARPEAMFAGIDHTFTLIEQQRSPSAIERACRRLTGETSITLANADDALRTQRFATEADEAAGIAQYVGERLRDGAEPASVAMLFRSVADVEQYEHALLERDIPVTVSGDVNVFADRRALDALALLWNVWDPFRHDWMIRTLRAPALALSDASVAALCSEPPNAQTVLFVLDDEPAPTERAGRWDPKRDIRLGWNVIRGDQDAALGDTARGRVVRFREQRARWIEALSTHAFADFVRIVWRDGLAREGAPDSARALCQQFVLRRLLTRLERYASAHPHALLGDILDYAQARATSDLESCETHDDARFVQIVSIDAAQGRTFDHIIIPDAKAGSFPRWYVPDAFLFSPKLGMIPKDNVGDARASRTAKFSFYLFRTKARDAYNAEERRAFVYALRRARRSALVTASGRATRGVTAPEFLEELRRP